MKPGSGLDWAGLGWAGLGWAGADLDTNIHARDEETVCRYHYYTSTIYHLHAEYPSRINTPHYI